MAKIKLFIRILESPCISKSRSAGMRVNIKLKRIKAGPATVKEPGKRFMPSEVKPNFELCIKTND